MISRFTDDSLMPYKVALILISFVLIFSHQNTLFVLGSVSVKVDNARADLVVQGLKLPTSMSFLGPNDILVSEKSGTVKRIVGNSILEPPILNIKSIVNSSLERGLLGIAIPEDSKFSENNIDSPDSNIPKIYLYFTEKIPNHIHKNCNMKDCTPARTVNSLYVFEMIADQLVNPKLLLSIPFGKADIGNQHIGGKITIGPDKRIYITGGDGYACRTFDDCRTSMNEGSLNSQTANSNGSEAAGMGGILAISGDAKATVNETILGDDFPLNIYYAYGIRNSFGLDFDPVTGNLWDTENGPYYGDEINLVKPGFNSGWAKVQGQWPVTDYNMLDKDQPIGYQFSNDDSPVNLDSLFDFNGKGKYSPPEFIWNKTTGPTAVKFFDSNKLGSEYKYDMFVSSYNTGRIYHFDLNHDRNSLAIDSRLRDNVANNERELADFIFAEGFTPITDLQVSPDGYLYVTTYEGKLWKITKSPTN